MNEPCPRVSVITTLEYPRHRPLECLASWTHGQTLPGDEIELLVVVTGRRRSLQEQVKLILRPQDRLIFQNTRDELALYHAGALEARGTWLMFTEPHCHAEPGCLESLLHYVQENALAGACVRTLATKDTSRVARMESRMYLEDARIWTKDGDWRKFTKRGTMVRKAAYMDAGGFPAGHLRFGEITFAAALRDRGHRLGYAEQATITHYNSTDLRELLGYVWEYRRQERQVAASIPGLLDGASCGGGDPRLEKCLTSSKALRRHLRDLRARKPVVSAMGHGRMPTETGAIFLWATARIRPAKAFAGAWLNFTLPWRNEDEGYKRYQRLWQTFGDLSVAVDRTPTGVPGGQKLLTIGPPQTIARAPLSALAGFHAEEQHHGQTFRWAGPIALLKFESAEKVPTVTLSFLEVRPLKAKEIVVFWDRTLLSWDKEASQAGRWVFAPKPGKEKPRAIPGLNESCLTIFCPPVPEKTADPRELGLPLVAVEAAL